MKGAILLDINNNEIFVSRNLTHHEHIFPYHSSKYISTWTYHTPNETQITTDSDHLNNTHFLDLTQVPYISQQTHEPDSLPT